MRVLSLARMQKYDMRKPKHYCSSCGALISGGGTTGLCQTCAQVQGWTKRDKKKACRELRAEINGHIKKDGVHPQCKYCRRDCRTWNAPLSKIIFCPRIEQICQQSASS